MDNKSLKIIGSILQYISFWLAAPEILGESRMVAVERWISSVLVFVPRLVIVLTGWVAAFLTSALAVRAALDYFGVGLLFEHGSDGHLLIDTLLAICVAVAIYGSAWLAMRCFAKLADWVLASLIRRLAHDTPFRQRCLIVGAIVFTMGFVLELIADIQGG
jgi:hypothetical protein